MTSASAEGLARSANYAELLGLTASEPTDARILDAALELFAELGISRVGIDDIARQAGVNRATLYRRIGSKDVITRAAILKEVARVLDQIAVSLRNIADDRQRVIEGFVITIRALRGNRILQKALVVDREYVLAKLTLDASSVLTLATGFVTGEMLEVRSSTEEVRAIEEVAALVVRLVHSLVLIPDAPPRLTTDDELRGFAERHLVALVETG